MSIEGASSGAHVSRYPETMPEQLPISPADRIPVDAIAPADNRFCRFRCIASIFDAISHIFSSLYAFLFCRRSALQEPPFVPPEIFVSPAAPQAEEGD